MNLIANDFLQATCNAQSTGSLPDAADIDGAANPCAGALLWVLRGHAVALDQPVGRAERAADVVAGVACVHVATGPVLRQLKRQLRRSEGLESNTVGTGVQQHAAKTAGQRWLRRCVRM